MQEEQALTIEDIEREGISEKLITLIQNDLRREPLEHLTSEDIQTGAFFSSCLQEVCHLSATTQATQKVSDAIRECLKGIVPIYRKRYWATTILPIFPWIYSEEFYNSLLEERDALREALPYFKTIRLLRHKISKEFYGDFSFSGYGLAYASSHFIRGLRVSILECNRVLEQQHSISRIHYHGSQVSVVFPNNSIDFQKHQDILSESYHLIEEKQL